MEINQINDTIMKKKTLIITVLIALLLAVCAFFIFGKKKAESRISFQTTQITTADISTSITATGTAWSRRARSLPCLTAPT